MVKQFLSTPGRRSAVCGILIMMMLGSPDTSPDALFAETVPDAHPRRDRIAVRILTKQTRLLREGKTRQIDFILPPSAVLFDAGGHPHAVRLLRATVRDGQVVVADMDRGREYAGSFSVSVRDPGGGLWSCALPGETRRYPFPLTIDGEPGGDIRVIVRESRDDYCRSVAAAEYGPVPALEAEAVRALEMLIAARCDYAKKRAAHAGYDFCDLTHCHVYRGRPLLSTGHAAQCDWSIDAGRMADSPLFHARCGGVLLDARVFTVGRASAPPLRDWIAEENRYLCRSADSAWRCALPAREIVRLMFPKTSHPAPGSVRLSYDRSDLTISIRTDAANLRLAPEDFRLRINRVHGWNVIKSNNYSIEPVQVQGAPGFAFSGYGLGHGVGLCQRGALALARLGYNRFEILEHYYPDIAWCAERSGSDDTPYAATMVFSLSTGALIAAPYPAFVERTMAAGSFIKLLAALYCAAERPDLFAGHRFVCTGKTDGGDLPERCHDPAGHGDLDCAAALSRSCNIYFASLAGRIDAARFTAFSNALFAPAGIGARVPAVADRREFARLLAGLDARMRFSVRDCVALARLLSAGPVNDRGIESVRQPIPPERRAMIARALQRTVIDGTAGTPLRPYGSAINVTPLAAGSANARRLQAAAASGSYWGKTSTVAEGSNRKHSYGMFVGGDDDRGVITILRKGNGHLAAKWSLVRLEAFRAGEGAR